MNTHIVLKNFGRDIHEGKTTIKEVDKCQTDLLAEIMNFRKNTKPRTQEKETRKINCS